MATVYVTIGSVGARAENETVMVYHAKAVASETITSSGTSAQGSLTGTKCQVAQIFCETAVYATAGADPTAAASNSVYVPANQPAYLALRESDKIAVIDV